MDERFHAGEIALQEKTGERDKAILNGRLIADTVPMAARAFIAQQSYCAMAWADDAGAQWVALLEGPKGFAQSASDGSSLDIQVGGRPRPVPLDAVTLRSDQSVGLLFIELGTRRRLRVNGTVTEAGSDGFRMAVQEAYPNCPKYIQRRSATAVQTTYTRTNRIHDLRGTGMPSDIETWLESTDTMFVASAHPERGADCSHRGGKPGFMKLVAGEIHIPDYPGNSMFGTLGNISLNPATGLCLLDFERNLQLHLTGQATLQFSRAADSETAGSGRWWTVRVQSWAISPLIAHTKWELQEQSPNNP